MRSEHSATGVGAPPNRERPAAAIERDPRWVALLKRDPNADETFWYSVATTGVFCRPSCGARTPRPENVAFYARRDDALRAGFRPCKRCKPDQPPRPAREAQLVSQLCRHIEQSDQPPSLAELAQQAGLSASHVHRLFKATTGLTPKAYARAHRAQRVRAELVGNSGVTRALYEAGYNSPARFYEEATQVLGMTPSKYRAGGSALTIRFAVGACSLGSVLVARSDRGVCAILLGSDPRALTRDLARRFPKAALVSGDRAFASVLAKVVSLVERPALGHALPLDIRGTAFQQRVWRALQQIPAGQTASYAEIARAIGAPKAARGVARACASNPLAVAIPCHRVVRGDGDLSGYRWGVKRKRTLLAREAAR